MSNTFKYKVPSKTYMLPFIITAITSFVSAFLAYTNNGKWLRFHHIFMFKPTTAVIIYWLVSGFLMAFAIFFLIVWFRNTSNHMLLKLKGDVAIVPRASWRQNLIAIPYQSIENIQLKRHGKHKAIIIVSSYGNSGLLSNGFSNQAEFKKFKSVLNQRVNT